MSEVTYGSLFAGIGGIDLGFDRAGMECRWQVENDPKAIKVLEKNWKDVHREKDVKDCGAHNLERVDVISAGFPCQDISYAGRGKGLAGERSGLFFEVARLVLELRPHIILLENVPALRTRGLDRVLGELGQIGYDSEWHCIPAAGLGAAHIRDRIFVLGYADSSLIKGGSVPSGVQAEVTDPDGRSGGGKDWQTVVRDRPTRYQDWETEPRMGRVVDGVPPRFLTSRLKQLGNAVCPPVAEFIGRQIMENYFGKDSDE